MLQMARKPFMVSPWRYQGHGVKRVLRADFRHEIKASGPMVNHS
jgi:hypothetical protein